MRYQIISFTKNGIELSKRIADMLSGDEVFLYTKCSHAEEFYEKKSVLEWTREKMSDQNTLIFIGACGIAVRSIAPSMADKLRDNPVLVIDEKGRFVIPLLSGHMGGANRIAKKLAAGLGAVPVITTATDLNGRFAVDIFAKDNGLAVENRDGIAKISAKLLAGEKVGVWIEPGHFTQEEMLPEGLSYSDYPADLVIASQEAEKSAANGKTGAPSYEMAEEKMAFMAANAVMPQKEGTSVLLRLRPKEYIIGIGCKKGREAERIGAFIQTAMEESGVRLNQIYAIASIDVKREEEGILAFCQKAKIPFFTFSAKRLQETEGVFHASAFVKRQVGVDNVCERAALAACGPGGKLILEKRAQDGMTIAIARRDWQVIFYE